MFESPSEPLIKSEVQIICPGLKAAKKCGAWSKNEVEELLSRQLLPGTDLKQSSFKEWPDKIKIPNRRLGSTLRSGLYNIPLLKELLQNGMPAEKIVRAMKNGLASLNPADLSHFKAFGAEREVLGNKYLWAQRLDDRLIENVLLCDLREKRCWSIIVKGLTQQNPNTISRLVLGGIDVAGILNWEDSVERVSARMIEFLRKAGVDWSLIKLVEEYGIEKETIELLNGLLDTEICRKSSEVVICKCSSVKLEEKQEVETTESVDTLESIRNFLKQYICTCEAKTSVHLSTNRTNYLRQNIMIALTWAMARMLHYHPTDPQYYLAHQLLRWSHGSVSSAEKREACKFVACATERMDFKLAMQKLREEKEAEVKEALKNIPCKECLNREEIYRNKGCPKCGRGRRPPEPCDLPELCSACRLPTVCEFPEICSACKLPDHRKTEVCDFPEVCSTCKLPDYRKTGVCELPEICSSCKLPRDWDQGVCDFPKVCSSCRISDRRMKGVCELPEVCSSCRLPDNRDKGVCDLPTVCSSCKLQGPEKIARDVPRDSKSSKEPDKGVCDFPKACSSCKLTADACDFPEVCSSCKDLAGNQELKHTVCYMPKLCSSCNVSAEV